MDFTEKENSDKHGSNTALERLTPFLSAVTCLLLIVVIIMLSRTNTYLKTLSGTETDRIVYEAYDDKSDAEPDLIIKEEITKENVLPILDNEAITEENTTQEATSSVESASQEDVSGKNQYVINKNSKKIHLSDCTFVSRMKEDNKETVYLTEDELNERINNGYTKCSSCGG